MANRLFETCVFPVAAPGLVPQPGRISRAALDRVTLFGIVHTPDLWPQYLRGVGLAGHEPRRLQFFDNVQLMYEAAANGLGIALAPVQLAQAHLASGRLVRPFSDPPVALEQSYYLVYRRDRADRPALRALRKALVGDGARMP